MLSSVIRGSSLHDVFVLIGSLSEESRLLTTLGPMNMFQCFEWHLSGRKHLPRRQAGALGAPVWWMSLLTIPFPRYTIPTHCSLIVFSSSKSIRKIQNVLYMGDSLLGRRTISHRGYVFLLLQRLLHGVTCAIELYSSWYTSLRNGYCSKIPRYAGASMLKRT